MRTWLLGVMAVVLCGAAWGMTHVVDDERAALMAGLDAVPQDVHTVSFTDWQQVRRQAGFGRLTSDEQRDQVWKRAFERDISARSVLATSDKDLRSLFGWSPADLGFELYAQSDEGIVLILGLGEEMSWTWFSERFEQLGLQESGGIWSMSVDEFSARAPGVNAALSHLVYDRARHIVIASDSASYLHRAADTAAGKKPGFADSRVMLDVAQQVRGAAMATLRTAKSACRASSLEHLTDLDRAAVDRLLQRNAALHDYQSQSLGIVDDGAKQRVVIALGFKDGTAAAHQMAARGALFVGDIVGQTGTYRDRIIARGQFTDNAAAVFEFDAVSPTKRVLTDLVDGPLLPLSCGQ